MSLIRQCLISAELSQINPNHLFLKLISLQMPKVLCELRVLQLIDVGWCFDLTAFGR